MIAYESLALHHVNPICIQQLCLNEVGQIVALSPQAMVGTPAVSKLSLHALAHLKAAAYWLHAYDPGPNPQNGDYVRGYLEAFYHFSELAVWELAHALLHRPIQLPTQPTLPPYPLYKQLEIWGNYQELTEMLRSLLGHLDAAAECFCLIQLGRSCRFRGLFEAGITYQQQAIECAKQLDDLAAEAQAHLELSSIYGDAAQPHLALQHGQNALQLATQIQSSRIQAEAFTKIATIISLHRIEKFYQQQALDYGKRALSIAQTLSDRRLECEIIGNLGIILHRIGNLAEAIKYYEQQFAIATLIQDLYNQWVAIKNLITTHFIRKDFQQAYPLVQQAFAIAQQFNSSYYKTIILINLIGAGIGIAECQCFESDFVELLVQAQATGDIYQEWLLHQCLAAIFLNRDLPAASQALVAATKLSPQLRRSVPWLTQADWLNFTYLLARVGLWRTSLRYARRGLAMSRRGQHRYHELSYCLLIVYAYWQGRRYSQSLGLLLVYSPKIIVAMQQSPDFRFSWQIGIQSLLEPMLRWGRAWWRVLSRTEAGG